VALADDLFMRDLFRRLDHEEERKAAARALGAPGVEQRRLALGRLIDDDQEYTPVAFSEEGAGLRSARSF
jgi:hypothetical protein